MTLLPAKRMGLIFVCSDVVTFIVQAGGGGMQVSADLADTGCEFLSSPLSHPIHGLTFSSPDFSKDLPDWSHPTVYLLRCLFRIGD